MAASTREPSRLHAKRASARVLATALLALACFGCGRLVFDHAPDAAVDAAVEGGAKAQATCVGREDGAPCDDRDVCTPASTCRAERCVASNAFDSCVVADSAEEFSGEQGKDGWYYGYWNATADADGSYDAQRDFSEMEYCGENTWHVPGLCGVAEDDPRFRWTMNLAWALQHPDKGDELELPVRRWVSDVSGPVRATVVHHVDGMYGDGTRALLLVDGEEVWRNDAVAGDTVGVQATLEVELEVGTVVEQIVHPIGSSADDMTYFLLKMEGR